MLGRRWRPPAAQKDEMHHRFELTFSVTGIATGRHGNAINPAGINLESALAAMTAGGDALSALDYYAPVRRLIRFHSLQWG